MSVLCDVDIESAVADGTIRIEPYRPETHLGNCSYDVSLGPNVYRMAPHAPGRVYRLGNAADGSAFWSSEHEVARESVVLAPGEMVLAHTQEFIGSAGPVVPMMKARSSVARWGVSVCMCAGWGDVGYTNRWTMEVRNHTDATIALPVGMRVAQIVFVRSCSSPRRSYASKYQPGGIAVTAASWRPDMMLPRLHEDVDVEVGAEKPFKL